MKTRLYFHGNLRVTGYSTHLTPAGLRLLASVFERLLVKVIPYPFALLLHGIQRCFDGDDSTYLFGIYQEVKDPDGLEALSDCISEGFLIIRDQRGYPQFQCQTDSFSLALSHP
jgi:hypothetical protein